MKFKQEKPNSSSNEELKNEKVIEELKLFKGKKIRLFDADKDIDNSSKIFAGLTGVLGENIEIGKLIILTRGKDEVKTTEVRNISLKNNICFVQTKDKNYRLEIA